MVEGSPTMPRLLMDGPHDPPPFLPEPLGLGDGCFGQCFQVVDKLSPQGNLPEGGNVLNLLKGFLG